MANAALDTIDDNLKSVIQTLYEIQSSTHGYLGPETHQQLIPFSHDLTASLSTLSTSASSLPVQIPPEIIEYVENARNPDIYTREFVEGVQRGNAEVKAMSEAMASFRNALSEEIEAAWEDGDKWVSWVKEGRELGAGENGIKSEDGKEGDGKQ